MVSPTALALVALALTAQAPEVPTDADAARAVGRALGRARLPWYDPAKDAARPLDLPDKPDAGSAGASGKSANGGSDPGSSGGASSSSAAGRWGPGRWAGLSWFGLGLLALLGVLIWLYRRFDPFASTEPAPKRAEPGTGLVEVLPEGLPVGFDARDPWAEAVRRRASGDLAGAILCLFAHQMLTLARLDLVRLAPGRTGRQLVRGITDADLRGLVRPTLGLFESTYYGRVDPTPEAFAAAWAAAEAFEDRVALGRPG